MRNRSLLLAAAVAAGAFALALACSGGSACDTGDCEGCCNADGECLDGTTAAGCGVGGGTCDECTGTETCSLGLCIGGQPQTDGGDPLATLINFCAAVPKAYCGAIVRCGAAPTVETCLQDRPDLFAECARDLVPAVREGRATFVAAKADACRIAIQSFDTGDALSSCVPRNFFRDLETCRGAVVGKVALNQPCFHSEECADGLFCFFGGAGCPGACQALRQKGEFADTEEWCAPGLYRYPGNNTCQVPADAGADCSPFTGSSQPQGCVFGHQCLGATPTCQPYRNRGENCTLYECKPLLRCPFGGGNSTCSSRSSVGGNCFDDFDCQLGATCEYPGDGGTTRGCTAKSPLGGSCGENLRCQTGSYCVDGGTARTCEPQEPVGSDCSGPFECLSFYCGSGKCAESTCHDPTP